MIDLGSHLDPLGLGDFGQELNGVLNDGPKVELNALEGQLAALDLREIEDVISTLSRFWALWRTVPAYSRCSRLRGVSNSRRANPMMPFIGVRIS
jgi:hypothetical protein